MRIVIESDDRSLAIDQGPAAEWLGRPRRAPVAVRDGGTGARSRAGIARGQFASTDAVDGGRAPSRRVLERSGQPLRAGHAADAGPPPTHLVARSEAMTARGTRSRRGAARERG
jgi:hypothetical protein